MPRVVVVSGSINAGKTTVSALVARALRPAAHVEGDRLRHFVPWLSVEEALPSTSAPWQGSAWPSSRTRLRLGRVEGLLLLAGYGVWLFGSIAG